MVRVVPSGRDGLDRGVERPHRHRHVARMGGDAGVAGAEDRVLPAEAADGGAAAAGLAFVAGLVGVVEIGAAGALQQIAGGRRLVAQLPRSAGEQRARQHPIVAPHARVGGEVGVAHQRADPQAAIGASLDLVEREAVDVDQVRRRLDLELHQVEQIGAAGDEACAPARARGRRRGSPANAARS